MSTTPTTIGSKTASTKHGVILLISAVLPAMAIVSLVPVMPLLLQEFSEIPGSEFLVPIALTIPALCVALFSPFAGWLSDRIGRKLVLIVALLLYSCLGLMPFFLTDLKQIIATRVGLGITEAAIMTIATALIGDYFLGEARQRWIALQVAVVSISAIVLIALGGALGETLGSRGPFLLYLLALPVAAIAAGVLFEPEAHEPEAASEGGFPFVRILPLAAITLGASILFYTIIVQLGALLTDIGVTSPAVIGVTGAGANFGHVVGSFIFHRLKKWFGPALLFVGFGVAAIGYLGIGLSETLAVRASTAFVASVGAGMLLPTLLAWILSELPAPVRGRGTGLWTGTFFLGQFIAPIVAVALSGQLGNSLINVIFLYAGIAALAAIASGMIARKNRVRSQR